MKQNIDKMIHTYGFAYISNCADNDIHSPFLEMVAIKAFYNLSFIEFGITAYYTRGGHSISGACSQNKQD